MELIEQMIGAQNNQVVGYTEFLQRYILGDTSIHCFYEGNEDRIYYHGLVRSIHQGVQINPYGCGNKDGVLVVFDLILRRPEYVDARTLFFIDRDFDALLSDVRIYETPYYSVENFYTQEHTLTEFLTGNLGILAGSADFDLAIDLFRRAKNDFYQLCRPVNAYLRCIAHKRAAGITPRLKIDNKINFKDGVSITVDGFQLNGIPSDLAGMEALFNTAGIVSQQEFTAELATISVEDMGLVGRGKFEMQFMVHFFVRFKDGIVDRSKQVLSSLYKCKANVDPNTFVNDFRSYAIEPEALRTYIRRA